MAMSSLSAPLQSYAEFMDGQQQVKGQYGKIRGADLSHAQGGYSHPEGTSKSTVFCLEKQDFVRKG